mmetsp:Transcript_28943/g.94239  ORF Transcript_28943/g.94239 Transcript_28943/m.94239 type:complete len:519 (-) Transcript_28943:124-1680(-)
MPRALVAALASRLHRHTHAVVAAGATRNHALDHAVAQVAHLLAGGAAEGDGHRRLLRAKVVAEHGDLRAPARGALRRLHPVHRRRFVRKEPVLLVLHADPLDLHHHRQVRARARRHHAPHLAHRHPLRAQASHATHVGGGLKVARPKAAAHDHHDGPALRGCRRRLHQRHPHRAVPEVPLASTHVLARLQVRHLRLVRVAHQLAHAHRDRQHILLRHAPGCRRRHARHHRRAQSLRLQTRLAAHVRLHLHTRVPRAEEGARDGEHGVAKARPVRGAHSQHQRRIRLGRRLGRRLHRRHLATRRAHVAQQRQVIKRVLRLQLGHHAQRRQQVHVASATRALLVRWPSSRAVHAALGVGRVPVLRVVLRAPATVAVRHARQAGEVLAAWQPRAIQEVPPVLLAHRVLWTTHAARGALHVLLAPAASVVSHASRAALVLVARVFQQVLRNIATHPTRVLHRLLAHHVVWLRRSLRHHVLRHLSLIRSFPILRRRRHALQRLILARRWVRNARRHRAHLRTE